MARENMPEGEGRPPFSEIRKTEEVVTDSSRWVTIAGIATIVLVILSFIGVLRFAFASIATIALGAGFLVQGLALTKRRDQLREELRAAGDTKAADSVGTGMTVEVISGVIGVVLGIIALITGSVHALIAISVIAFGVALITGGPLTVRLDDMNVAVARAEGRPLDGSRKVVKAASGIEVGLGVVAVVLGILGLIAFTGSIMLLLVGLIASGVAVTLSNGVLGRRSSSLS